MSIATKHMREKFRKGHEVHRAEQELPSSALRRVSNPLSEGTSVAWSILAHDSPPRSHRGEYTDNMLSRSP